MDSTSSTTGIINILSVITGDFPVITLALDATFGFLGVLMVVSGIRGFHEIDKHGSFAHGGYNHKSKGGLVWRICIGIVLTGGAWGIGIIGNTIFGADVAVGPMAYATSGLTATQQAARTGVFAMFMLTGYIAFGNGWMLLNDHFSGKSNGGAKGPIVFIVAGTLLVYLSQILTIVTDLTGISFTNMLLF